MSSLLVRNVRLVPVTPPELGGRHTASAAGELDSGQTVAAHAGSEPVDVRVVDGVVTQVGPGLADDGSPVLEGEGRWAIPGLWDQHVHSAQAGLMARRLDVSGTAGPEEVTARVAEHVRSLDERPDADRTSVVSAWGHRSATWSRPATVAELDAVSGEHPVVIVSGDGHNGWLNSLALQRLGAPATQHALDEDDWFPVFGRLSELTGDDDVEGAVADLVADANARGVVGIVDFEFGAGYARWPERVAAGLDTLRVRPAVYPELLDAVLEAGLRTGQDLAAGLVTMGPLKIISDGSLNTRTAYCCEPYVDAGSLEFPRGKVNFPLDRLTSLLSTAHGAGLEIALHAIGDAAVEPRGARQRAAGPPARRPRRHRRVLGRPVRAVLRAAVVHRRGGGAADGVGRAGLAAGPLAGDGGGGPPQRRRTLRLAPRAGHHPGRSAGREHRRAGHDRRRVARGRRAARRRPAGVRWWWRPGGRTAAGHARRGHRGRGPRGPRRPLTPPHEQSAWAAGMGA
nr:MULTISPECIES: amidohydrolase family protein [Arsenicicoccus]